MDIQQQRTDLLSSSPQQSLVSQGQQLTKSHGAGSSGGQRNLKAQERWELTGDVSLVDAGRRMSAQPARGPQKARALGRLGPAAMFAYFLAFYLFFLVCFLAFILTLFLAMF